MHLKHRPVFCYSFFEPTVAIISSHRSSLQNSNIVHLTKLVFFACLLFFSGAALAQEQLSQTRTERLYQTGSDLITHKNFGAARKVFSEFLESASANDPRRGEASYYVAFSALSLGHSDGEKLIDSFIDQYPTSPKAATAYFDLANFFYGEKNYSKAANYYGKVDFPSLTQKQQTEGHFKWGYSAFSQKKLDDALQQFNFVKNASGEYAPAANYYAGFVEYSKGLYDEALVDLKKAEKNASYASVVPYLIANIYYRQKKFDELIQYAESLKGRSGLANEGEVSMLVAEAYYYKGDYKSAVPFYEQFLGQAGKADAPILFRAGYAHYEMNQPQKALGYLSKAAASKDTIGYYASYYLGILYLKQGEKPLAINAFDYARKHPKDEKLSEEATFQLAKVSYDAGRPEQAITEFEKFLKTFQDSKHAPEVRELLAQAYINGNNYNKAIEYIETLSSRSAYIDQAYQKATYLKGADLYNRDDFEQAVRYFKTSLQYPKDPVYTSAALFWLGESLSMTGNNDEAIGSYERVLSMGQGVDPDLMLATRYALGYAYFNQQDFAKALPHFREFVAKANKSNPNYSDGTVRLADCFYASRQYSDALSTYTRARSLASPDQDYILLQSATIFGIQKSYAEARSTFGTLIQNYPKSQYRDEAMFQRAMFEIEQGNYQASIDGLSQLISANPNSRYLPNAYMRRASSYFNLKQYDKTIDDYTTLIRQFPSHPGAQESLLPLQEALTAAGRSGEYETYLALVRNANPDNKNLEYIEFESAKNLYFDQQYQKALNSLNGFIAAYPSSSRLQEARYYVAESHYRLKNYKDALPIYIQLSGDQSFSMAGRVTSRVAELQFRDGKFESAIGYYRKLEMLATSKKEQFNAWSGLMESYFMMGKYDSADIYAKTILDRGAVNASAVNKASLYLGKTAYSRGDLESAKDEFLNTLNMAQDEYGAEAKYMLGLIFYQQKDYAQCYKTLVGLNNDFSSYEFWVGKSFLLLADNALAQNDIFQARGTLQSLIENFPSEQIRAEAKKKLSELERRELEKQQSENDSTDNN